MYLYLWSMSNSQIHGVMEILYVINSQIGLEAGDLY